MPPRPLPHFGSLRCRRRGDWVRRQGAWVVLALASAGMGALTARAVDVPGKATTLPTVAEVSAGFRDPAPQDCATVRWSWDGPMTGAVIARDLDALRAVGFRAVTIEAGYGMDRTPYLSDDWFELVGEAVAQAKERDMRVWIKDEGRHPSGFAGGRFTRERPDLLMQGLDVAGRVAVASGEAVKQSVDDHVVGALAVERKTGAAQLIPVADGALNWTAPVGEWEVRIVDHQDRTPATRSVENPTHGKDTSRAMGDLLNPAAAQQFIDWTHEGYRRHLGEELGRTVLGFRGDEPGFACTPWTPGIADVFAREKGYDVRPYLAAFVSSRPDETAAQLTDEMRRVRADYWDVWSRLFADNGIEPLARWCTVHGMAYTMHLNHDHDMHRHVASDGDYFRAMRPVTIPAVDAIWNQVWPGRDADFVKLPSSVAHLLGRPRVFSESFAAYRETPVTAETAEFFRLKAQPPRNRPPAMSAR